MAKRALQIVVDAVKNKRGDLIRNGETLRSLKRKYRLQMPRTLIDRAIEESKVTVVHPITKKLITIGKLDGKVFFGFHVVEGDEVAIILAEESKE